MTIDLRYFIINNILVKMVSFALVTRLHIGEIPYIKSFLDYYISIGISKFYIVNTKRKDYSDIIRYLKKYSSRLVIKNINNDSDPINCCQDQIRGQIVEDYILNCDCDEYLILKKKYKTLHDLHKDKRAHLYKFKWDMVPCDGPKCVKRPYKYTKWCQEKYIVDRKLVKRLSNHHPVLKRCNINKCTLPNIIHFWSRTFNDTALKCVLQTTGNSKSSSQSELLQLLDKNNIPARFKVLAYLCLVKRENQFNYIKKDILNVDYDYENKIIAKYLTPSQVSKLQKLYFLFKHQFKNSALVQNSRKFFNLIGLATRLKNYPINLTTNTKSYIKTINCKDKIFIKIPHIGIKNNFYPESQHNNCLQILDKQPGTYVKMQSFAIVQNPWKRVLVYYLNYVNKDTYPDFNQFVQSVDLINEVKLQPMFKHICDTTNSIIVDTVLYSENLDHICQFLGLSRNNLEFDDHHQVNYRTYYTGKTSDIIGKVYAKDIKLFNYIF